MKNEEFLKLETGLTSINSSLENLTTSFNNGTSAVNLRSIDEIKDEINEMKAATLTKFMIIEQQLDSVKHELDNMKSETFAHVVSQSTKFANIEQGINNFKSDMNIQTDILVNLQRELVKQPNQQTQNKCSNIQLDNGLLNDHETTQTDEVKQKKTPSITVHQANGSNIINGMSKEHHLTPSSSKIQQVSPAGTPVVRKTNISPSGERRTVIMGDSTLKLLDKRKVLSGQLVSKANTYTIDEAMNKISNGEPEKENIVFAIGVNDLKMANDVDLINNKTRDLIEHTHRIYPNSKIFICSLLPTSHPKIDTESIICVNSYREAMPKYFDYVQYVDIYGQFLSQLASEVLFEDNIHPNLKGTIIIAACIRKTILENSNLSKMTLRRQISPIRGQKIFKNQTPKTVQLYPGQKESNEENMSRIQKNTDGENFPPLPSRQIQNNSTRKL